MRDHVIRQSLIKASLAYPPLSRWPPPLPVRAVAREFVDQLLSRTQLTPDLILEPELVSLKDLVCSQLNAAPLSEMEPDDLVSLFETLCSHATDGTFIDHWKPELSSEERVLALAGCAFAHCVVGRPQWADAHSGLRTELVEYVDDLLRGWILKEILDPAETRRLSIALPAYAQRAAATRYYWRSPGELLEAGKEPVDIAFDVLGKTLDGTRRWDPRKHPDLEAFLRSAIDSELNNLARSKEHLVREPSIERYNAAVDGVGGPFGPPNSRVEGEELLTAFRQTVADDPRLSRFLDFKLQGYELKEIYELTGWPMEDVYGLNRRLKRRCLTFVARWRAIGKNRSQANREAEIINKRMTPES